MVPEIKIIPFEQLEQMSNDVNKKYFYIKNNYKEEIKELQDSLGMSVNFIELLDNQHAIIKVNSYIYNNKYNRNYSEHLKRDIDYRKLKIERKERILKDLNQKVWNRFIDKLYAQEIVIDDLPKKLNTFLKLQNNLCNNNNNISYKNKHPTLNIIVPKNSSEFSGTIAFE